MSEKKDKIGTESQKDKSNFEEKPKMEDTKVETKIDDTKVDSKKEVDKSSTKNDDGKDNQKSENLKKIESDSKDDTKEKEHHKEHIHHHKKHVVHHKQHKKEKLEDDKKNKKKGFIPVIIAAIIVVLIIALVMFFVGNKNGNNVVNDPVKLEMYVMSQCPYGTQVVDAIAPVKKKLGDNLNLDIEYITYPRSRFAGQEDQYCVGNHCGMHGVNEVKGDIVQLCAKKYNPDKYLDLFVCMNENVKQIPNNWETCANKYDLKVNKIKECYEGDEGIKLLDESNNKAISKRVEGSPTIFINGELYNGGRNKDAFLQSICRKNNKIDACKDVEPDPEFKITMISDKRCTDCQENAIISTFNMLFPTAKIKQIDYANGGKEILEKYGLKLLPAMIIDKKIEKTSMYKSEPKIGNSMREVNGKLIIDDALNAHFDPNKEICDNGIDDTGDGLVDCAASECKSEWSCVEKTEKPKVELFVMSHCPYGTQIEKGIIPVLEKLGDKIDFQLKFVNYVMHGEKEIKEEMNQYCIKEKYPDKLVPYLKCFLEDADGNRCMNKESISAEVIETCVKETDDKFGIMNAYKNKSTWKGNFPSFSIYNEDNIKYGIRGSPSLRINGIEPNAGRDPKSLMDAICYAFKGKKPAECNEVMDSTTPAPDFGYGSTNQNSASGGCGA